MFIQVEVKIWCSRALYVEFQAAELAFLRLMSALGFVGVFLHLLRLDFFFGGCTLIRASTDHSSITLQPIRTFIQVVTASAVTQTFYLGKLKMSGLTLVLN